MESSGLTRITIGSWLVNTARGAIVVKEDVAAALKSGHLRGYGGDVWFPQPAPKDHPLRYAQNPWGGGNAMVPHMSGTSIDAQKVRPRSRRMFDRRMCCVAKTMTAIRRRHQGHPRLVLLRPRGLQARGPDCAQGRLRHQGVRPAREEISVGGWRAVEMLPFFFGSFSLASQRCLDGCMKITEYLDTATPRPTYHACPAVSIRVPCRSQMIAILQSVQCTENRGVIGKCSNAIQRVPCTASPSPVPLSFRTHYSTLQ